MENAKNLAEITEEVSNLLLDCKNLLEIFEEIACGDAKEYFLLNALSKNVKVAFDFIEKGRLLISKPN